MFYVGPVHISTPVYSEDVVLVSVLLYWKSYVTKQPMSDRNIINMGMILMYDLRYNGAMQMNRTCMLGDLKENL